MPDCAFCTNPEIKERLITSNTLAWAFPSNMPIVPGHTLISPIRHVTYFNDLTLKERNAIFDLVEKIKTALRKVFQAMGFNYAWNEEKIAGQSVPHFHLHLVPRKAEDRGIWKYEPRDFLYRPGERPTSPEEELLNISKLIQDALE